MNIILSDLVGTRIDDPKTVIYQGWTGYNTGCLIKTSNVYSICNGKVISVEFDPKNDLYSITVELNSHIWVRYCKLSNTSVAVGQSLKPKDFIGIAYKQLMRLEYCNTEKSPHPIREIGKQFYKHDPTPLIFGAGNLEAL